MRGGAASELEEDEREPSAADVISILFLREFSTRYPVRKPMGAAAQAVKILVAGARSETAKERSVGADAENAGAASAEERAAFLRPELVSARVHTASGLRRRIISVGRSLSLFALKAAALTNDGAVESVLYLSNYTEEDAMTQRMRQSDVAALQLTVIAVAKRIGARAQVPGGQPAQWAGAGVMPSSLDDDGCVMVVTPGSGTGGGGGSKTKAESRGGGPEDDFCVDYGQVVLVRIGGKADVGGDVDVDVDGVLRGMQDMIRLGRTRAVLFETSGADRSLSSAARHFHGAPYDVYWVGRYDALRTAASARSRTRDQPSLVRIDGEYYRPLLEEFVPPSAVKTVLAVRRDDAFAATAVRYGLTVCDAECRCKVPEDKPCQDDGLGGFGGGGGDDENSVRGILGKLSQNRKKEYGSDGGPGAFANSRDAANI